MCAADLHVFKINAISCCRPRVIIIIIIDVIIIFCEMHYYTHGKIILHWLVLCICAADQCVMYHKKFL